MITENLIEIFFEKNRKQKLMQETIRNVMEGVIFSLKNNFTISEKDNEKIKEIIVNMLRFLSVAMFFIILHQPSEIMITFLKVKLFQC